MGIYLDAANKNKAVRCDRNSGHPVIHPNFPKSILQTFANYLVHSMLHIMHHGKDWVTMSASAGQAPQTCHHCSLLMAPVMAQVVATAKSLPSKPFADFFVQPFRLLDAVRLSGQSTSHTSGNVTIHGIEHLALSAVLWTNCLAMSILYKQLRKQNALGCFGEVGMKVLKHPVQCSLVVVYPLWWSAVDRKACLSGGWVGCEVLGGLIEGQTPEFWACFSGFTGFDSGRVTA